MLTAKHFKDILSLNPLLKDSRSACLCLLSAITSPYWLHLTTWEISPAVLNNWVRVVLSFKKFDNLLLYLSLKVRENFMNSQHLRLKWHFEKLDKYGPKNHSFIHNHSAPLIYIGFRSEDWDDHGKSFILCISFHFWDPFLCWFWCLFWIIRFRFFFYCLWYLIESMMPSIWTRCPGLPAEKQTHNIKNPAVY